MFKLFLLIAFLGLLIFGFLITPPAQAICRASAHCYMSNDYGSEETDGPYEPCYSAISWTFHCYRTDYNTGSTQVQWKVTNQSGSTVLHREYLSSDLANEQTHYFYGSECVGSATSHTLHLKNTSTSGGYFTDLDISLAYYECNQSK